MKRNIAVYCFLDRSVHTAFSLSHTHTHTCTHTSAIFSPIATLATCSPQRSTTPLQYLTFCFRLLVHTICALDCADMSENDRAWISYILLQIFSCIVPILSYLPVYVFLIHLFHVSRIFMSIALRFQVNKKVRAWNHQSVYSSFLSSEPVGFSLSGSLYVQVLYSHARWFWWW